MADEIRAYPLTWPDGWPRALEYEESRFYRRESRYMGRTRHTVNEGVFEVLRELKNMGVPDCDVIISTNVVLRRDGLPRSGQKTPDDPGVAVYFKLDAKDMATYVDLVLDNGELVRIECPEKLEDDLLEYLEHTMKIGEWWSPHRFDGCSATYLGHSMGRINMKRVVGML